MVLNKYRFIIASFFLFLSSSLSALSVPQLKGRVNDYANIIDSRSENEISTYLDSLEQTTGIQIAVLTIHSLDGENIASFSLKVCDKWQLGENGKDNGALLLVAYDEHQVRIETGYGLEDKLTDAKCGLIIRNVIIPEFKSGNYSSGILKGVKNIGGIASDNVQLVSRSVQNDTEEKSEPIIGIIFMIIWLIFMISILSTRGGRRGGLFSWLFWMNMFGSGSGRYRGNPGPGSYHGSHGSSFGENSFGRGPFGGNSGGFSGGGGHFGGGGAGGSW